MFWKSKTGPTRLEIPGAPVQTDLEQWAADSRKRSEIVLMCPSLHKQPTVFK